MKTSGTFGRWIGRLISFSPAKLPPNCWYVYLQAICAVAVSFLQIHLMFSLDSVGTRTAPAMFVETGCSGFSSSRMHRWASTEQNTLGGGGLVVLYWL